MLRLFRLLRTLWRRRSGWDDDAEILIILGGGIDRELAAARFAATALPHVPVVLSSGAASAEQLKEAHARAASHRDPRGWRAAVVVDRTAVDTLTNFTSLAAALETAGVQAAACATSPAHAPRAAAVGSIVLGAYGVQLRTHAIDCPAESHEGAWRAWRDVVRALLWVLCGVDLSGLNALVHPARVVSATRWLAGTGSADHRRALARAVCAAIRWTRDGDDATAAHVDRGGPRNSSPGGAAGGRRARCGAPSTGGAEDAQHTLWLCGASLDATRCAAAPTRNGRRHTTEIDDSQPGQPPRRAQRCSLSVPVAVSRAAVSAVFVAELDPPRHAGGHTAMTGDDPLEEELTQRLKSGDRLVRSAAARELALCHWPHTSADECRASAIAQRLLHRHAFIRVGAARGLGARGRAVVMAHTDELAFRARRDPSTSVRMAAVEALGMASCALHVVPCLDDPEAKVRAAAVFAVIRSSPAPPPPPVSRAVAARLDDADEAVRRAAAHALLASFGAADESAMREQHARLPARHAAQLAAAAELITARDAMRAKASRRAARAGGAEVAGARMVERLASQSRAQRMIRERAPGVWRAPPRPVTKSTYAQLAEVRPSLFEVRAMLESEHIYVARPGVRTMASGSRPTRQHCTRWSGSESASLTMSESDSSLSL